MNWEDIVYDPGSTTKAFKFLGTSYNLEILFSDFEGEMFKRAIIIKLDNIPVMVAISKTHISSELFLNILQNAQTTPIGVRLFAPKSGITRGLMEVQKIDIAAIDDEIATGYINALGMSGELYFRTSTFTANGTQTMNLTEYILPGLKFIINQSKK